MTKGRWHDDPDAVREAERLYQFIGQYVIAFQWLEGKVEEMLLLARGQANREETFAWLARKTNNSKIEEFQKCVSGGEAFREISIDGWAERFGEVIARLHDERRRRNGLLHAQYLFDFLAIGAPVLRTDFERDAEGVQFTQEGLSATNCDAILQEVAQLSLGLNMICVQLVHAYIGKERDR